MTRIIGGTAGSLKLQSPAKSTRPTSDRVREAIFNRLQARAVLTDATVLDLYAGTGALALEALSHGAKSVVMVEANGKAAAVCVANAKLVQKALEKADTWGDAKTVAKSVSSFLTTETNRFDLVFIDPPYEISNEEVTENLTALLGKLNDGAHVILERSSRTGVPTLPPGMTLEESKNYGDTDIHWISIS